MSKLRIAVIGGGHLGRIHTRLLQNNDSFELVAVAENSPVTRDNISNEFQIETIDEYRDPVSYTHLTLPTIYSV